MIICSYAYVYVVYNILFYMNDIYVLLFIHKKKMCQIYILIHKFKFNDLFVICF